MRKTGEKNLEERLKERGQSMPESLQELINQLKSQKEISEHYKKNVGAKVGQHLVSKLLLKYNIRREKRKSLEMLRTEKRIGKPLEVAYNEMKAEGYFDREISEKWNIRYGTFKKWKERLRKEGYLKQKTVKRGKRIIKQETAKEEIVEQEQDNVIVPVFASRPEAYHHCRRKGMENIKATLKTARLYWFNENKLYIYFPYELSSEVKEKIEGHFDQHQYVNKIDNERAFKALFELLKDAPITKEEELDEL